MTPTSSKILDLGRVFVRGLDEAQIPAFLVHPGPVHFQKIVLAFLSDDAQLPILEIKELLGVFAMIQQTIGFFQQGLECIFDRHESDGFVLSGHQVLVNCADQRQDVLDLGSQSLES